MRPTTRIDWQARVGAAIEAMLASLDEPLKLEKLAREAASSPWHFHRRFRELSGESLSSCLRRLRLERAAYLLSSGVKVIDAALLSGFEGPEAFSRAFKRLFGLSPAEVARLPSWEGRAYSRAGIHYKPQGRGEERFFVPPATVERIETKIVELPPRRLFSRQAEGGPWGLPKAWEALRAAIRGLPILEASKVWLSAFYGGMEVNGWGEGRFLAAFEAPLGASCPEGLQEEALPGGLYALFVHFGSYEEIGAAVERWEKAWFPASGWHADPSRPCYEWYQNGDLPSELLLTFWCCPVKKF
jgi:AraC-like DNA-binding protein/DNA gyrase inhibitor GyrI